jgi:prevent-host-death family protein
MRTISAMDLRRKTGEWLDRASAGERIVIERDRRPLAILVSVEDAARLEQDGASIVRMEEAFDRLAAIAREHRLEHPETADLPGAARLLRDEREARTDRIRRDSGADEGDDTAGR